MIHMGKSFILGCDCAYLQLVQYLQSKCGVSPLLHILPWLCISDKLSPSLIGGGVPLWLPWLMGEQCHSGECIQTGINCSFLH